MPSYHYLYSDVPKWLVHDRKHVIGFSADAKRFDVAVTRANAFLIVVDSPRVLASDEKSDYHSCDFVVIRAHG